MNPVTHATNVSQAGHSLQMREGRRDGVDGGKMNKKIQDIRRGVATSRNGTKWREWRYIYVWNGIL